MKRIEKYHITDKFGYVIHSQDKEPTIEELKQFSNLAPEAKDEYISCSWFKGTDEVAEENDETVRNRYLWK